jgi:hypothetical protein
MSAITDPATHANYWRRTRAMFARACEAIGDPAAIAALNGLTNTRRRQIARFISLLECIVRKLLFALASQLGPAPAKAEGAPSRTAGLPARIAPAPKAEPQRGTPDLTQPQTWRARFALAPPRDPCAVPESRAPRIRALWGPSPPPAPPPPQRAPQRRIPAPLRLAFRLEALRRVIADPEPLARRVAQIFQRLQRRDPRAGERYVIATARPYFSDRDDARLIVEAMALAMYGVPLLQPDTS